MVKIELNGLEFFAYHGVYEEERRAGNNFIVNLAIIGDFEKAVESDKLEDTLNYELLYEIIADEMHKPSNLLEHVAGRIRNTILEEFSQVKSIEISIEKLTPPIKGKCQSTKVTLVAEC